MLKVYLDMGAKEQTGGVMCVAGALFKQTPYKQFCRHWEPMLRGWGAPWFHATDFYSGGGDYFWRRSHVNEPEDPARAEHYRRDSKQIPIWVGTYAYELFVVCFKKSEYESIAPANWRARYGGVHRIAVQMMGSLVGFWAKHKNYGGKVAYFYETGDAEGPAVDDAFRKLYDNPRDRQHCRMASTPIGVDKGGARGLEVADFLAWQWNKFYAETLAAEKPRQQRKDLDALITTLLVHNKKPHIKLFTGEALEEFLIAHGCHPKWKSVDPNSVCELSADFFSRALGTGGADRQ